jgi:sodium-dependent dicarboxylate transporter 2/3/5
MSHVNFAGTSQSQPFTWKGGPGYKPRFILAAFIIFITIWLLPPPQSMLDMVKTENPSGYSLGRNCKTIVDTVNQKLRPDAGKETVKDEHDGAGHGSKPLLTDVEVANLAKLSIMLLLIAAFLWGTEALPLGATDVFVAVILYLFAILPLADISRAYMTDAVFFIFGILAVAVGVSKTGLDKRIGLILLSRIKSSKGFAFIFLPTLAMSAAFLSEHALVALLIPVLMGVYKVTCRIHGVKKDPALAVFLILSVCLAANHGGPGSPAAGGRNAIMMSYFADYGMPMSFGAWMIYGMPFVPLMSVVIGAFMYLRLKPKFLVKDVNPAEVVRAEVANMPKFGGKEAIMAVILVLTVAAWILIGEHAGLGGPTLYAVMAMFIFRIIDWEDVQQGVAFDVVGLYASACAIGVALKFTGGGLWIAHAFVAALPEFMAKGDGLTIGVSLLTGTMTNFMSDGATVAALGPIVLPMATLAGVHAWQVGLSCAFSSSFANILIVGTPNNAIAFGMAKDPETGERLLDVMDFVKYGLPITILAWLVLWFWTILGYWKFLNW